MERSIAKQIERSKASPLPGFAAAEALPETLRLWHRAVGLSAALPGRAFVADISGRIIMPGQTQMRAFKGKEFVSAVEPLFEWNIRLDVAPGIWVHVIDRYEDGRGQIDARVLGAISIINDQGIEPLNITQLSRWLGLATQAPHGLMIHSVVQPETDGETIRAIHAGRTVTSKLAYHPDGTIASISSNDRFERYGPDVYHKTGSIIRRTNYVAIDGLRVPLGFSVIRIEPDGSKTLFLEGQYSNPKIIR
jgi:hypothetical protein